MAAVHHIFASAEVMVEVHLAAGTIMFNKATDIHVAAPWDLMIEVDGQQHFGKHHGDTPGLCRGRLTCNLTSSQQEMGRI